MRYIMLLLFVFTVSFLWAQSSPPYRIEGHITNADSRIALENATIYAKASGTQTNSDQEGRFTMSVKYPLDTLIITLVGYKSQRLPVSIQRRAPLQISLRPVLQTIEEVTVNTGYQAIPKERATGSFSQLNNAVLNQQVGTNVITRLEAVANSFSVYRKQNTDGQIMIRGLSTIRGPKDPLIIVDNFPYAGDINNINPNDVESITLLKDAAAASIWGVQAGNGVIVITTKKGKLMQKIQTEFNTNITIADPPDLFYSKKISPNDLIDVETMLFSKGYRFSDTLSSAMPPFSPAYEILFKQKNGSLSQAEAAAQLQLLRNHDVRNDFNQYLYRKAVNQQYSITVKGGAQNTAWLFGAGWDKNLSNLGAAYNRLSLHADNTITVNKKLSLTISSFLTQSRNTAGKPGIGDLGNIPVYTQLADLNGLPLPLYRDYRQTYLDTAGGGKLLDWKYLPLADYQFVHNTSKLFDWTGSIGLNYTIIEGLSLDLKYQYERQQTNTTTLYDAGSYFNRDLVNSYTQLNRVSGQATTIIPKGGILDISNGLLEGSFFRGQMNYNRHWPHATISAIAGSEIRQIQTTATGSRLYGYNNDILTSVNVDFANPYPTYLTGTPDFIPNNNPLSDNLNRFVSYFGNAAYTRNEKYTLSASVRRDASNLFGVATNNRWTPLWSAGLSWNLSREAFYHLGWLPFLKIRATYGVSGNTNPAVSALTTMNYSSTSPYTGTPYGRILNFYNPELRWEKSAMFNFGIDFKTKGSRVAGSLEYYHKKGTDLYGNALVDITAGLGVPTITKNVASMVTSGLDLELTTVNTTGKVRWSSQVNLSLNTDHITDYYLSTSQGSVFVNYGQGISGALGKPVYTVFNYRWAGLDPATGDPQGYSGGQPSKNYTALLTKSTLQDLRYSGQAMPKLFGSMGNTLSWRNINLTVRLMYQFGYWFQRSSINYQALFHNGNGHSDYALRWQQPGDEKNTNVPSLVYPAQSLRETFYNGSEVLAEKGDHIRLQYIHLGYTVSKKQSGWNPFERLEIYLAASNLGILWRANKSGIDPMYRDNLIPPSKTVSIGVKASF